MTNIKTEYYIGCFEVYSFDKKLSEEIWKKVSDLNNLDEWDCVGKKIFPIQHIKFQNGSKDIQNLSNAFEMLKNELGEITIKGEIFSVDDYSKRGCRLLKIKNKIEPVVYEVCYEKQNGYFDWIVQDSDLSSLTDDNIEEDDLNNDQEIAF